MIKLLGGLVAVLAMGVGTGVAVAAPATYDVTGTWTLTIVNGQPTIQPEVKEDTIDVTCRDGNHMQDFKVSDQNLVSGSWRRVDGTGVQVEPKLTKPGDALTVTAICNTV
ncbi:MAG: hypothetical protein ACR2G2_00210 [Pseudonocardia sp.]